MDEKIQTLIEDVISRITLSGRYIFNVIFSMVLAAIIGIVISQIYKKTQRGMNHEITFMSSLVVLAPIVTLIMLFIEGDIIVSLGLIGSLSIIRFRTAIKDTRDMIFLFWSVAVGLGAGTYNWSVVVIGSIIILSVIFILYLLKYGKSQNMDYILVVISNSSVNYEEIDEIINKFAIQSNVRSQEIQNDTSETVIELAFKSPNAIEFEQLTKQLYELSFIKSVSLLSPRLPLPA
ncbi:MAG: DUF4956 domain-containing protein [Chloroflexota bacterium]|nr:DUF4956 domain-containing protein [Chloroflexota bacterium]